MENHFWLKVRKEYVFDNFEEMVEYIRRYDYDPAKSNIDYDDTLDCVQLLIQDLADVVAATPFYGKCVGLGGRSPEVLVRMMAVAFLGERKRGKTDHGILLTMVNYLLFACGDLACDIGDSLWNVVVGALRGLPLDFLGFSWSDVDSEKAFSMHLFMHKLANTQFSSSESDRTFMYEHQGLLTVDPDGKFEVSSVNHEWKTKKGAYPFFTLGSYVGLLGQTEVARSVSSSFDELFKESRLFLSQMRAMRHSPKRILFDYGDDDDFVVRVTFVRGHHIVAETIDPRYRRLSRNVLVNRSRDFNYLPSMENIRESINVGDHLYVRHSADGKCFELVPLLDELYRDMADELAGHETSAVFCFKAREGSVWITKEGLHVMIHKEKVAEFQPELLEAYNACIGADPKDLTDLKTPLRVRFYKEAPDLTKTSPRIYVEPVDCNGYGVWTDGSDVFSVKMAELNFMDDFKMIAHKAASDLFAVSKTAESVSQDAVDAAAHVLFSLAHDREMSSMERLRTLVTAAAFACVSERDDTFAYLQHRMDLLERMVAFAHNRPVRPLEVSGRFSVLPEVENAEGIVSELMRYNAPSLSMEAAFADAKPLDNDSVRDRVATLVSAFNSLAGIIGAEELNNVKMAIARAMGVADEFEPLAGKRTFYGTESLTLEFKKSIVFPPVKKRTGTGAMADPERQKWAILKTVCGFLNSRSGGELLLGVNDNGYAYGLDDDIRELSRRQLISVADIDRYRNYVRMVIDGAFKEFGAPTLSTDIVTFNVSYLPETNPEGKSILRIQVRPYPYGVVGFCDNMRRPDDVEEAYVRRDGCTKALTPALRAEVERYKLETPGSETRVVIDVSRAIAEKRVVVLRGYSSGSGRADRTVEPYKIWKKRGLVYGFDVTRKEPCLFKLTRAEAVELTQRKWQYPRVAANVELDWFGMILDKNSARCVILWLTEYGKTLLEEEYPDVKVRPLKGVKGNDARYRWECECLVSSPEGLERFVRGLPDEVRKVE